MKTIESLSGNLNGAGVFTETYGILNSMLWEHPEVPGHFVLTTFGYGGLKFKHLTTEIAMPFSELFALATAKEPNLLPQLPQVVAAPNAGAHPQMVTLTCAQAGAEIRYTVDGSTPTQASTLYAAPINVAAAETIKAIAFKTYWKPSNVASFVYS